MATNPIVQQGTLNRLRGSMSVINSPALNVSASYLGKGAISLNPEGDTAVYLPTLTGAVTSNEPYQIVVATVHLLKTQPLAAQYQAQIALNCALGDCVLRLDSSAFSDYYLNNCVIVGWDALNSEGTSPDYVIRVKGYSLINSSLWNLV